MMATNDRKMFSPMRRGESVSPEAKLFAVLGGHAAGSTAVALADELVSAGLAVGPRAPVRSRVAQLLVDLEQAGRVERIPDGRYRIVRPTR